MTQRERREGRRILGLPVRSGMFDFAVVLGFAALFLVPAFSPVPQVWRLVFAVAMVVPLLFRRRYPTLVFLIVAVAAAMEAGVLAVTRHGIMPHDLAILVAMYSVVKYGPRKRDGYLAAAVVAAGSVVVGLLAATSSRLDIRMGVSATLWVAVVSAVVWLLALNQRTRRLYIASLEERAVTAERERDHLARIAVAEERARIARELHDVVAHSLAVMIVQADGATYAIDTDRERARQALQTVASTGREALAEMRRLVSVLRGTAEDTAGSAPDGTAAGDTGPTLEADDGTRRDPRGDLGDLVARSRDAGLAVTLTTTGDANRLPAGVGLAVYRIVQESLTNVLKHAGAGSAVTLHIDYADDEVRVEVTDDGAGRPATAPPTGGHGLVGMRERVAVYGGTFHAGSRLGGGWKVTAVIPLPPRGERATEVA